MIPAMLALVLVSPSPLDDYLKKADPSFAVGSGKEVAGRKEWTLTSQTWQGHRWEHKLTLAEPTKASRADTAILIVTGNEVSRDHTEAKDLAEASSLRVATVFNVPNQPLWGRSEDALIAHSFVKWFESGDDSWPLLFPMTKSVLRAMDALERESGIKRFIVTGASKRGWTSWLAGASGDKRIIGIAPMVFDFLNFVPQLEHQKRTLGAYSEMISDYTEQELQETVGSPQGQKLVKMVDPYAYLSRLGLPKLIVTGANDRYWSTDAMSLYRKDLPGETWTLSVPNAGHNLGDGTMAMATLAAFADSLANDRPLPKFEATFGRWFGTGQIQGTLSWKSSITPSRIRVYRATSTNLDFRDDTWKDAFREQRSGKEGSTRLSHSSHENAAYIVEAIYRVEGRTFSLTTPPLVVPARR